MRIAAICLLSVAALLQGCGPKADKNAASGATPAPAIGSGMAGVGLPAKPPKPVAGLWKNQMTMTGPRAMTVSSQICLDAAMLSDDAWMKPQGGGAAAKDCTQSYAASAGGYSFQSTCKMGDKTITSQGVATGDFKSDYKVDITSTMAPAMAGMPAETKMSIVATRLGACPAGMAPGMVPGSMSMTQAKG